MLLLPLVSTLVVTWAIVRSLRLGARVERFASDVAAGTARASEVDGDELFHEARLLQDQVRTNGAATSRASFLAGAACAFFAWASAIGQEPPRGATLGLVCFGLGAAGGVVCGILGRRARDRFRHAADRRALGARGKIASPGSRSDRTGESNVDPR